MGVIVNSEFSHNPAAPKPISDQRPDWSRENITRFFDPGPKLLRAIRKYQRAKRANNPLSLARQKYWSLVHRFWSVVSQCEIQLNANISGGLLLPHPSGIIIHPEVVIGPNCLIFQQVTLAEKVEIGGHVDIGAGAKILGPLVIGAHARIGANAVVTKDVAPRMTVVGSPARPTKITKEHGCDP